MGGNVSREVAITDGKSGTMSNSFSWSGTFPRGMSLEGNLSTKLTKFKKFEVTPKKKSPESKESVIEEEEKEEASDKEFIESLLINVLEDALDDCCKKGMTKSSTLPANMKGLGVQRTQSFGKRIRKSIRKLVVKTPKKEKKNKEQGSSEDIAEALLVEVLSSVTGSHNESIENLEKAELAENIIEETTEENEVDDEEEDEVLDLNTSKSFTLPANFAGLGENMNESIGKRIRKSLKKFVTPKKNGSGIAGSKESNAIVEILLEDIIDNIGKNKESVDGKEKDKVTDDEENAELNQEKAEVASKIRVSSDVEDVVEATKTLEISDIVVGT